MTFDSLPFPFLLAGLLLAYRLLPAGGRGLLLLAAGYAFYAGFEPWFCLPLLASTFLDFYCALGLAAATTAARRRLCLGLSLAGNLGMLFFYKYCDFLILSFAKLAQRCGLQVDPPLLHLMLPLGISFYTFQSLSYTLDVYRGTLAPCRRLRDFALYVAYFPQLLAWPIERAGRLLPQLAVLRQPSSAMLRDGLWLILLGYYKKVVVADNLSLMVGPAFASPASVTGGEMALAIYAYAFQVYCDFSGYSDLARGISRLFGVELMLNFRIPFFAANIQEFWNRWHISLSSWVRDYLYGPLARAGLPGVGTRCAAFLTMLIIGIWHGAAWKFAAFGAYHGVLLVLFDASRAPRRRLRDFLPALPYRLFCSLLTFHLAVIGLAIFGCKWLGRIPAMLAALARAENWSPAFTADLARFCYFTAPLLLLHLYKERKNAQDPLPLWSPEARFLACAFLLVQILAHGAVAGGRFIYFQF